MMGEYVKRSDALQAVGDVHPLDYNGQGIVERIKAIPAADVVEVVHASWVAENSRPKSGIFYCSCCHRTCYDPQPTRAKGWTKRCRYHYCPSCGAKMDGGQDE